MKATIPHAALLTLLTLFLGSTLPLSAADGMAPIVGEDSEQWQVEDVGYFYLAATGDTESSSLAILPQSYCQSRKYITLLEKVIHLLGQRDNPTSFHPIDEAKPLLEEVLTHALGRRLFSQVKSFKDGTFGVVPIQKESQEQLWGLLNGNGVLCIKCHYRSIDELGDGVYAVEIQKGDDALYGAVNRQGQVVIPIKYQVLVGNIWSQKYGHVILRDANDKVGMMNLDGTVAIPFKYAGFGDEYDHVIVAKLGRHNFILLDKSGHRLTQHTYEYIEGENEDTLVGFRNNTKYRLNAQGKEIGMLSEQR